MQCIHHKRCQPARLDEASLLVCFFMVEDKNAGQELCIRIYIFVATFLDGYLLTNEMGVKIIVQSKIGSNVR